MRSGESQEREALEKTKSAFQWLYHRPVQEVFDEAFTAGYRAALAAREDTARPGVGDYECVEYQSVVKHRAFAEPLIERHHSGAEAEEWLDAERKEKGSAIEYARVEWRMSSRWITPPDRRFFTRRTEANTPRSEMEPNRRKLHDRRAESRQ
jgi:hypothetical protein